MAKATSNHFVHGHAGYKKSPTYKTWRGMKLRCNNPTNASYKNYGAKGIGYCERWETFELFLEDMGERPEGMTLDRRDRSKDYCLKTAGGRHASNSQRIAASPCGLSTMVNVTPQLSGHGLQASS